MRPLDGKHSPQGFLIEKEGTVPRDVPVLVSVYIKEKLAEEALRLVVVGRREIIFIADEPHQVLDAYVVETAVPEIALFSGNKDPSLDSVGGL